MFIFAITYVYVDIDSILAMQKWIKKNGNDLGMGKLWPERNSWKQFLAT